MVVHVRCNHVKKSIWTPSGRDEWVVYFSTGVGPHDWGTVISVHTYDPALVATYTEGQWYAFDLDYPSEPADDMTT
jgi:hypothetical protein